MKFIDLWPLLCVPGEFDMMDACDRERWRGVIEAAFNAGVLDGRERCARLLDVAHEQRKHVDNYAAFYARMIRELRLIEGPNVRATK